MRPVKVVNAVTVDMSTVRIRASARTSSASLSMARLWPPVAWAYPVTCFQGPITLKLFPPVVFAARSAENAERHEMQRGKVNAVAAKAPGSDANPESRERPSESRRIVKLSSRAAHPRRARYRCVRARIEGGICGFRRERL